MAAPATGNVTGKIKWDGAASADDRTLILCGLTVQVGAICRDQDPGSDSSLEGGYGPRDTSGLSNRAANRPT